MTSPTSIIASRIRTVCAAALFVFAAAAANAHPECDAKASSAMSDVPSVAVSYSDLNLATTEGNRVLLRRIVAAAEKVCPVSPAPGSRLASRNRGCLDEAIARAVSDTKSAQLAEMQAARGRRDVRS